MELAVDGGIVPGGVALIPDELTPALEVSVGSFGPRYVSLKEFEEVDGLPAPENDCVEAAFDGALL